MTTSSTLEMAQEYEKIDDIIKRYFHKKSALIAILQDVESLYNFLPEWTLRYVSKELAVPLIQVYGVASFYDAFHLKPRGKHLIRICLGTACYLRGAARVLEATERELGIKDGGTTPDLEFSLQSVRCLGACALAPVLVIDDTYFDKVTPNSVSRILKRSRDNK